MKHALIKIAEIPDTGSTILDFFGRQIHVYKANGKPVAISNTCLHFGGPLDCKEGKFVCPWHGAEYAMEDGHRLKAPAPSDAKLMFLSTRIEDDTLYYVWGE